MIKLHTMGVGGRIFNWIVDFLKALITSRAVYGSVACGSAGNLVGMQSKLSLE